MRTELAATGVAILVGLSATSVAPAAAADPAGPVLVSARLYTSGTIQGYKPTVFYLSVRLDAPAETAQQVQVCPDRSGSGCRGLGVLAGRGSDDPIATVNRGESAAILSWQVPSRGYYTPRYFRLMSAGTPGQVVEARVDAPRCYPRATLKNFPKARLHGCRWQVHVRARAGNHHRARLSGRIIFVDRNTSWRSTASTPIAVQRKSGSRWKAVPSSPAQTLAGGRLRMTVRKVSQGDRLRLIQPRRKRNGSSVTGTVLDGNLRVR